MNKLIQLDQNASVKLNKLVTDSNINHIFWKYTAEYSTYLVPVFLVYLWFAFPKLREVSLRTAVTGLIGWKVIAPIIAHFYFRERPVDLNILGEKEILFKRPDYSFPSDHAIFLFSIATGFYLAGYKQLALVLYLAAIIISLARVVVGVHFLGDVIVGAIIGIFIAWLAWQFRTYLDWITVKPWLAIAKFLKLI